MYAKVQRQNLDVLRLFASCPFLSARHRFAVLVFFYVLLQHFLL